MTWRLATSLNLLRIEVNRAAPKRSTASDGSIGDAAHSSRTSDHNPNDLGVVRAIDVTNDPAGGFSAQALADHVASMLGKHPALGSGAYVIWNRRIISTDRLREGWREYTGSNPHDKHVHISVCTRAPGYDSPLSWNWPPVPPAPDLSTPNADAAIKAGRKLKRANPTEAKAIDRALAILRRVRKRIKAGRR